MNFASLYRASFYLMLFFATLTLSVDVPESSTAMFYPLAVAVAAVVAFLTVDRYPRLGLSRGLSNWLALLSVGLVIIEYSSNSELLLLSLAHWLVYLQLIKMFLPKRVGDDWFLFLLGLMQVLVGAVGSQSDLVGQALAGWVLMALWVLALFSLHRDALRYLPHPEEGVESVATASDPYPGLLNAAFVLAALRVTATTLALGGVIFLAMPRRTSMARTHAGALPARHLTGFDEEVKLGQLGEILENDSVVMSIELYDYDWKRIRPPVEPLWRGVTMASYENGRWQRQQQHTASLPPNTELKALHKLIRQHIRLEPSDSPVLFGLRPMLEVKASSGQRSVSDRFLNTNDGTLVREDPRSETFDYRVDSLVDPDQAQPGERLPRIGGRTSLLEIPMAMREPLRAIAEHAVREFPDDDLRRARALEQYLRSSGFFRYSLQLGVTDREIDPVLDFLVNRKSGHCGYFASALALLLRSIGIPARMVNGFKGGDWNEIAQVLNVRQKHAHSWVEALISPGPDRAPIWITLDATPTAERNEAVASVGGFATNFRLITDLVRYVWVFYIVGYNADRQQFLLYEPIRNLVDQGRSGFQMMGQAFDSATTTLFGFRDFALISWHGFIVSFTFLLTLVGLVRGGLWLWWQGNRWYRGNPEDSASLSASQVSYRRLTQLLSAFGVERPAAETQHEFASRASAFLTGRGSSTAGVSDVPPLVVDAYYRVRFGHNELSASSLEQLERRLDALEASLNANAV